MKNSLSSGNLHHHWSNQLNNKSFFFKEHKTRLDSLNADFPPNDFTLKPLEIPLLTKFSGLVTPNRFKTKGPSLKLPISIPRKVKSPNESDFYKNVSERLLIKTKQPVSKKISQTILKSSGEYNSLTKLQGSQPVQDQNESILEKSPIDTELLNISTHRHLSNSPKKNRPKLNEKNFSDFKQIKLEIFKGMNKSQEKIKLQELKNQSPKIAKIQQTFDELNDLRRSRLTIQANFNFPPDTLFPSISTQRRQPGYGLKENSDLYCMSTEKNSLTRQAHRYPNIGNLSSNIASNSFEKLESSSTARNIGSIEEGVITDRYLPHDPFDKLIIYKNKKMPFSLALMAKMRHQIFQEVKQPTMGRKEKDKTTTIKQLKDRIIPEEKAKFLEKLDEVEKKKKYHEMQSKKAHTSAIYQLIAMDKTSQKRLKSKMKEQFPSNSRFLNIV